MTGEAPSPGGDEAVGERQVPFYCPYCGEEDLRPAASQSGSWVCQSCRRSFVLRFAGLSTHGGQP
jgi:transposase-like protein